MASNQNISANKTDKEKINERIAEFFQKNRRVLFVCLGIVIAGAACFIAVFIIRDRLLEKAWSRVEEFSYRYESLKVYIGSEDSAVFSMGPEIENLRKELIDFAGKNSGFPAARAHALIAGIYEDEKNWAEAETSWVNAAKAAPKTYFVPVSFFKAAVAAEEQGRLSSAVEYYEESLKMSDVFPAAPRAQFAIGRIQEAGGEKAAALESYRTLVSRWPADQFWTRLAQSRILVLGE